MRKLILILAVGILLLIPAGAVLALTSQEVTVTATPSYMCIANAPGAWAINDVLDAGDKTILKDTTYYSNPVGDTTIPSDPVVDGECKFTITNTSSVPIDLTVNFPSMTGGDAMSNVNLVGADTSTAADADSFVAWSYCTGMTPYATAKVLAKATESSAMKSSLAAITDIKWGLEIQTKTDDWGSGTAMTSTVVITATATP